MENYKIIDRKAFFSKDLTESLKETFKLIFDVLVFDEQSEATICLEDGRIVAVGQAVQQSQRIDGGAWIGMTVYDLEKNNIYNPSVAAIALKEKRRITRAHRNPMGKDVVSTSVPVFYENSNRIQYVISFEAINIENEDSLTAQFSDLKRTLRLYREKINQLESEKKKKMELISFSSAMNEVRRLCDHISRTDANILITGESGVGKNVIAKYIHENSSREEGAFVEINCSAIPESLIESELFGYEKGAFTGANIKGKKGLIEMAHKGTLFLDEIGELPLMIQTKFLRVIQQKKIVKVGGTQDIDVDFRLITATNKDLMEMIDKRTFREDLFYRLNVVPIHIKPLRERKEDIIPLAKHFLQLFNHKYEEKKVFTKDTASYFYHYDWPGNVRELENLIERLVVTSSENELDIEVLLEKKGQKEIKGSVYRRQNKNKIAKEGKTLREDMEEYERKIIQEAYEKYGTSVNVGLALGIAQTTAAQKIRKYVKKE